MEWGIAHAILTTAVIIRLVRNCALGRMIQYSRDVRDEPRGRGVMDRPVEPGDDGGGCGSYCQTRAVVAANRERHHLTRGFS